MRIQYYFVILLLAAVPLVLYAHGDGLASEILPPSAIGNKNVTLSIGSTPFLIGTNGTGTQIGIVLLDANSNNQIPDATISISAFKGDNAIFGHIFQSDSGKFILSFYPQTAGSISINEQGNAVTSFFGHHAGMYEIKGPALNVGGLYRFKIEVLTMDSYDNKVSKSFDAAISIPQRNTFTIHDPKFGDQQIRIIAYYDRINNFKYDPTTKAINFTMPFDWSQKNIDSLTVVHQEIQVPRKFSDYIVTKYDVFVNNLKLPDKLTSIDDYSSDNDRTLHIILFKNDVRDLLSKQPNPPSQMAFSIRPSTENIFPIVQYTRNAQYKVALSWNPEKITTSSTTDFNFKIMDPYRNNATVGGITYDFSVLEGQNGAVFHQVGKTSDSDKGNNIDVTMPKDYVGTITVALENLNDNSFADAEFTATVSNSESVPEFPLTSLLVLVVLIGATIFLTRTSIPSRIYRQ